jgi:ABC-type branched-subunit amino acid transport system substrate-binding protein
LILGIARLSLIPLKAYSERYLALLLLGVIAPLAIPSSAQKVEPSKVAIELISFEEGISFLVEASKFEELSRVKWYGSDGAALSAKLLEDPTASRFAANVVWKNTITFAATDIAVRVYWTVKDRVGYSPDPYSFISYDSLWVLALAIAYAGGPEDVDRVADMILKVLETYEGATGKIRLNEFGDRAGSDYAIFAPVVVGGKVEWRMVELYDFARDMIVKVEKDPFAERPATLPTALPKFSPPPKPAPTSVREITIGALYPITGDLATFGKANVEALKIALEDVNKWFEENGYPWRFKLDIRDSETKPDTAKSLFRALHGAGVRYFLGPMSSGELKELVADIGAGFKAVVISPSSTSPVLAIKDTVFRFPPPDDFQGRVLNMLYKNDGVTHVIIVYRNDDWGKGLADFVKAYEKDFGIKIVDAIPYDPKAPAFGALVETVRAKVRELTVAPTPTPTTPAPGVSPALIAAIAVIVIVVAAIAYYLLRR